MHYGHNTHKPHSLKIVPTPRLVLSVDVMAMMNVTTPRTTIHLCAMAMDRQLVVERHTSHFFVD